MSFQKKTPGKTNRAAIPTDLRAIDVVQAPDEETAQKHAQSVYHHEPHSLECLQVAHILVVLALLGRNGKSHPLACQAVLFRRVAPSRSEGRFHGVHAAEDDDGGQGRVCILVEDWVLKIVVVQGDEYSETCERNSEKDSYGVSPGVRE